MKCAKPTHLLYTIALERAENESIKEELLRIIKDLNSYTYLYSNDQERVGKALGELECLLRPLLLDPMSGKCRDCGRSFIDI